MKAPPITIRNIDKIPIKNANRAVKQNVNTVTHFLSPFMNVDENTNINAKNVMHDDKIKFVAS